MENNNLKNKKSNFIKLKNNNDSNNNDEIINTTKILNKNKRNKKFGKKGLIKSKINENKFEFIDEEMNELTYDLAVLYDKRTYCEYYISLLKTKHGIIYSFIYNKDYNSRLIKIDLFFIEFTINYIVNALFFTDETMNKIYENKGAFDFIYQLSKIIYASIISLILIKPLEMLALSNDRILDFKKNKKIGNIIKAKNDLIKKLKIKFVIYFIISFIFLLNFWYYISMFGAIYKNTQMHLIKDTLISFGLSFIYPFGMLLLPGIFRIPSLSKGKNKRKCLYKLSKILQLI